MAKLSEYTATDFAKIMYIGDSGAGKTGSLVSLVKAGYKLRVLDMDVGIGSLFSQIKKQCPDLIDNVDVMTFRDKYKADTTKGIKLDGRPTAYTGMLKALNEWDDGTVPSEWGSDTILAVDTLTAVGRAALNWAEAMNPTARDPRQWFFTAQTSIETLMDLLTSESFQTNVLIMSHVQIVERPDGTMKGYASSVGSALGPKLPKFVNTLICAEAKGTGDNVKRTISTRPTTYLDLKVPDEDHVSKSMPLNEGLATIFESIRGPAPLKA